jgi:hypothetical protein
VVAIKGRAAVGAGAIPRLDERGQVDFAGEAICVLALVGAHPTCEPLNYPAQGCVAVLTRDGGGHVAIVTGISSDGRAVRLLGGNQGDAVSGAWFATSRVKHWRAPAGEVLAKVVVADVGQFSSSEA